ncbi:MAG: hypothetical protein PUI48_02665 [Oscillospiraceae bacterium]|nr:hypothetical protein [Oscillospiraceae bacterium]MDY6208094.1 hypothetical protein [Oscillospiraceae bacterium]
MDIKYIKFRFLVDQCIRICICKINNMRYDDEYTTDEIKNVILPEMTELKKIDKMSILPPANERYITSYACAFKLWGWNMKKLSSLFRILAKINAEYKHL